MKKTYINPNIEVVKMKMHQHLLDGSPKEGPGIGTSGSAGDAEGHFDDFDW